MESILIIRLSVSITRHAPRHRKWTDDVLLSCGLSRVRGARAVVTHLGVWLTYHMTSNHVTCEIDMVIDNLAHEALVGFLIGTHIDTVGCAIVGWDYWVH